MNDHDLRNDKRHFEQCLKPLGIDKRPITGYTGEEWKRILAEPAIWLSLIENHKDHPLLLKSMKEWPRGRLYMYEGMSKVNDEKAAEVWGSEVLVCHWAKELSMIEWCPYASARNSFYLHVIATHAWRWFQLHEFATYAMEKVNANFKQSKRRSSFDRKTLARRRSAKGARGLETMMKKNNIYAMNLLRRKSPLEQANHKRKVE